MEKEVEVEIDCHAVTRQSKEENKVSKEGLAMQPGSFQFGSTVGPYVMITGESNGGASQKSCLLQSAEQGKPSEKVKAEGKDGVTKNLGRFLDCAIEERVYFFQNVIEEYTNFFLEEEGKQLWLQDCNEMPN